MTSLPERLRSAVLRLADGSASRGLLHEAADELDRRAVRIRRLEYWNGSVQAKLAALIQELDSDGPLAWEEAGPLRVTTDPAVPPGEVWLVGPHGVVSKLRGIE
jgi:hypothetical protein